MFHQIMTWFLNMCFLLIDILKLYNLMYRKISVLHNKFKQVRWNIKSQSMSNYQQDLSNLVYVKFCICRILYMPNFTMSYSEVHRFPFGCRWFKAKNLLDSNNRSLENEKKTLTIIATILLNTSFFSYLIYPLLKL